MTTTQTYQPEWSWRLQETINTSALGALLESVRYKDHWSFEILAYGGCSAALTVNVNTTDPTAPRGCTIGVLITHQFLIPAYPMNQRDLEDFIFECIVHVENHEAGEFFYVGDQRPYEPEHGEGADPYAMRRRS